MMESETGFDDQEENSNNVHDSQERLQQQQQQLLRTNEADHPDGSAQVFFEHPCGEPAGTVYTSNDYISAEIRAENSQSFIASGRKIYFIHAQKYFFKSILNQTERKYFYGSFMLEGLEEITLFMI